MAVALSTFLPGGPLKTACSRSVFAAGSPDPTLSGPSLFGGATSAMQRLRSLGYPESVSELNDEEFRQGHPYKLAYISDKGKPVLFYGATFLPFEQWEYDFTAQTWKYVQD